MGLLEAKSLSLRVPDRARRPLWGAAPRVTLFRDLNLRMKPGETIGIVSPAPARHRSHARC